MLLIKNGHIINPVRDSDESADIFIAKGKIKDIGKNLPPVKGAAVIDAAGLIIAPGLVDAHAHFRDPGYPDKEDIESGAKAAARGGYTSVVLMANTDPCVDNIETLRYVLAKGEKTGINIFTCAAVTRGLKGREIVDIAALKAAGAVGFSDDGRPLLDEALAREAMLLAAKAAAPLCLHEEDPAYITNNGINEGAQAARLKIGGAAREAEITMVRRDLALAAETGAAVVFQHISTAEAVHLIGQAKKTNPRVFAEASPHHFTLTEEAVAAKGTLAKMNPPLRTARDRLALIRGLRDGAIDLIATDHAPHSQAEKARPFLAAPSGIIGLETALSLGIRELVIPGYLTMSELLARMSGVPAGIYHLPAGDLAAGENADLVIFDPNATWQARDFYSKSANSPFSGEILPGVVCYTICKGKIVYQR